MIFGQTNRTFLVIFSTSVLLIGVGLSSCSLGSGEVKPDSSLTQGLSGKWAEVSAEFDSRVKARFALGSSDTEMGRELQRQGFSRSDWETDIGAEHRAMRREDQFPCKRAAYVYWRATPSGSITAIRGTYREEGCV